MTAFIAQRFVCLSPFRARPRSTQAAKCSFLAQVVPVLLQCSLVVPRSLCASFRIHSASRSAISSLFSAVSCFRGWLGSFDRIGRLSVCAGFSFPLLPIPVASLARPTFLLRLFPFLRPFFSLAVVPSSFPRQLIARYLVPSADCSSFLRRSCQHHHPRSIDLSSDCSAFLRRSSSSSVGLFSSSFLRRNH